MSKATTLCFAFLFIFTQLIGRSVPSSSPLIDQQFYQIVEKMVLANSSGTETLAIQPNQSGHACNDSKPLNVPIASRPDNILVLSPHWFRGSTCPNTVLELEASDDNPAYPTTTYQWSISGATILSGQGTPYLFVRTSSNSYTNLSFSVRARIGSGPYSAWRTISGNTSSPACGGGGGGYFIPTPTENQFSMINTLFKENDLDELNYQLIAMNGQTLKSGKIYSNNIELELSSDLSGLYILRLFSNDQKIQHSSKQLLIGR